MTAKLKRYKPTIGHQFMRTDAVMVPATKGGYVDYEEALAVINRLERKVKSLKTQPDASNSNREQQNG